MQQQTIYQITVDDLQKFVIADIVEREYNARINRFHNSFFTPEELANLHGVSRQTVYNYVKFGIITPEFREKDGGGIRFRCSDALKMDFKELQKAARRVKRVNGEQ